MKHHILKLNEEFWVAVLDGSKCFEVRYNDRGFQKGDSVSFMESMGTFGLTDENRKVVIFEITYVLSGWGIEENYVVFGMKRKDPIKAGE